MLTTSPMAGLPFFILALVIIAAVSSVLIPLLYRTVVPTNVVHIVQNKKSTKSYGKDNENGNCYYKFPAWIPFIGVQTIELPVSNFDLPLDNYPAYDKDRVPFVVDVTAFFRIADTNKAAQRISNMRELTDQLKSIVQGAVRSILSSHDIDEIMTQRETFGDSFTSAVTNELAAWGVTPVKNLELMDIRDDQGSTTIQEIMAKKQSFIEMESRIKVSENNKLAEEAEIINQREVDVSRQKALKEVGIATASQKKEVGIATERSNQEIAKEEAITADKNMEIVKVNTLRQANIDKDQSSIGLEQARLDADAHKAAGDAEAAVRKSIFEADNALEIRLKYNKETAVGVAEALSNGDIKLVPDTVISGSGSEGSSNAMDTLAKMMTVSMAQSMTTGDASAIDNTSEQLNHAYEL